MQPLIITTSREMDELSQQLSKHSLIAVDTEFHRETSYYPRLALVQFATDSLVACVDPLAFDARPALQEIFLNPNITKIFHACSQDLEVLFYYLGEIPAPVYDTQIANALLTEHHQIGYAAIVENELGVQLDKSQTRTNWLQRPLTEKQIQYAGDDVYYLYQLHHILENKLQLNDRKNWLEEENKTLVNEENNFQVLSDKLWKRVKGATKLARDKLAIVQSIALWREQLAQKKDRTRRKVFADDSIIQLALKPPETLETLRKSIQHKYTINKEELQALFEAVVAAGNTTEEQWPDNRFSILDNQQKQLLKNMQQLVNAKAGELGISSAILCSRKDLEKLILHYQQAASPPLPQLSISHGWRYRCIGQHLLKLLK